MAFQLPPRSDGPSTPSPRESTTNEDSLVSALQAAFSFGHNSTSSSNHQDLHSNMLNVTSKDRHHMSLDILVASDVIPLKGTGVDVEPALLSGHVSLYLTESTSFKEITLQFRGKARVPVNPTDPHVLNSAPSVYIVCSHDWSFLEGQKKHSHTLKPGRHLFPFQLRLGGSLPSSISTSAYGGASVTYKLRAMAVRPGFSSNLTAMCPIVLIRSLASEALEFQQTMEIENTWPEKLMYSIMLPHKAWAAGDDLLTLIKFTPLAKGVRVLSITTYIYETTKTFCRSGHLETTKAVITRKHEIIGGRAVSVEEQHRSGLHIPFNNSSHFHQPRSVLGTPSSSSRNLEGYFASHANSSSGDGLNTFLSHTGETTIDNVPNSILESLNDQIEDDGDSHDVSTSYTIPLSKKMTPSHALDPIQVSHRIRWSILIYNPDGHTSELRCSLPIHILDPSLLEEARRATKAARALLLGMDQPEEIDDNELPSYPAHVRDRVANVYLPESATMRVTNPWVHNHIDPVNGHISGAHTPASGIVSPLEARHLNIAHLPPTPDASNNAPLEWVNSELLLSLSDRVPPAPTHDGVTHTPPEPESVSSSRSLSRRASRRSSHANSRANSRANSPERPVGPPTGSADDTHIHSQSSSSRQTHGLFSMNMKPLTSLTSPWASMSSNRAHTSHGSGVASPAESGMRIALPTTIDPTSGAALLHRAFTETPEYEVAARGFLGGGVPPLESMRGLPSYEEVRSASDSNLVAHFQRGRSLTAPSMSVVSQTAPTTPAP